MIGARPTVTAYAGRFVRAAALAIILLGLGVSAAAAEVSALGESETDEVLAPVQTAGPFEFPWSLGFLPAGSMLVTERAGRLRIVAADGGLRTVSGLPPMLAITKDGQAGLLDVAVDPRFSSNGFIYLSYSHGPRDSSVLRVLRARLDAATARLDDGTIIYESTPAPVPELYGGRLAITNDGYLFLGLGDRFARERAQDLGDPAGTIVRIRTDGAVPSDNPFATTPGARPEIWSYGHRNPLGLAIDDQGRLWSHENGPSGGDELNLIRPGRNYGWPVISHGVEYSKPPPSERHGATTIEGTAKEGMEQPFYAWTPAIAPSGLALEPTDGGVLFWIGGLAARSLIALEVRDDAVVDEERHLAEVLGRIRDVRRAPDGFIYVLSDGPEGILYRLDPQTEHATRRLRTRRM
jgi:glucose/arabinose dehydrogenase